MNLSYEELFFVVPKAGVTAVSKDSVSKADRKILMHGSVDSPGKFATKHRPELCDD
jgi:hypothetical protein